MRSAPAGPVCPMLLACSIAAVAGGWPPPAAADWPQWRGPTRDGRLPAGQRLPAALAAGPEIIWRVACGGGFASPVLAGGKLFHFDCRDGKETLHALDAASGRTIWSAPVDETFKDGFGTGPRCTPLADGQRVFAQSCRGELQCRAADDGKLLWRTNYVADFGAVFIGERGSAVGATRHGNNGSPVIDGQHLIAPAGGASGAGLVCFRKANGEVVWKAGADPAAYASPVVAELAGRRQVVSFSAAAVVGVDARDGALLWRVPVKTSLGRHCVTPVIAGDIVVVGSYQAGLLGIRVRRAGETLAAAVAWTDKDLSPNVSTPVVIGERFVLGHGRGRSLFCVEADGGKAAWTKADAVACPPGRAAAALLTDGRRVLMLGQAGELALLAADAGQFRLIGTAKVCGPTWCTPALADGRLYLRDEKSLLCVRLGGGTE